MSEDQTTFQIILLTIGILSTVVVAYLFKFVWKPNQELLFEKNVKHTTRLLFSHLGYIDSYKNTIFGFLEEQKDFDINNTTHLILPEFTYKELFRFRELILDEIKYLSQVQKFSAYVTLEQYLAIQQYATSIHFFIHPISNEKYGIFIFRKSLEYHRYYAKQIIDLFGKSVPDNFYDKWKKEFVNVGGIHLIKKPKAEPGDIAGPYYNLNNELLYFDSTFSTIMEELAEIKKTLADLKDAKNK